MDHLKTSRNLSNLSVLKRFLTILLMYPYEILPSFPFKKSLSGKGQVTNDKYISDDKAHKDIHYLGKNEDGTIRKKRCFIQQGQSKTHVENLSGTGWS